ncbi:MAG: ADP-glyceromanno-heptose 6-epimerase [bacterium]
MIIVTGASGFIGSAIVSELNSRGITDILCVDSLKTDEKWKNLVNLKFDDYEEKEVLLKRILFDDVLLKTSVEGIIHMGACSSTTEKDASFLIDNNYKYTQLLAKWCVRNSKKFVYASSAATYGDGTKGFNDSHETLATLQPLNAYGYSKHLFDIWAYKKGMLENMAGLKFTNVYGPNEYHKDDMRSVVHKAFGQIKATGKLKLFKSYNKAYANGEQQRDFIYVKDAVNITLHAFETGLKGIYNCGTGKARSWNSLATAVFKALDLKPKIEYIDMPVTIRDKYQYFTEAKMNKMFTTYKKKLYTLEEGVDDYVKNYLLQGEKYLGQG